MAVRQDLKFRTKRFGLDILRLAGELRPGTSGHLLKWQLVRAGTGVGANYRASCRAKSRADFIAKMTTTEEEADEAAYWLEVLIESGDVSRARGAELLDEANQLTAIFVASIKTAKSNTRER
jgi:four helix bundle protein